MRPRAWLDENRKRTGVFGTALRVPLMLAVFANLLSSCAVGLVNKWLVAQHRFDHIIFLTSCQMAFTAAGMRVMLRSRTRPANGGRWSASPAPAFWPWPS